ncbi:MAG: type II toxin-antitoxin system RelE/ParE family toxin [Pseudomonadota bacterium]
MNYVLHPAAALEHEQQVAYYQERQAGLGARYHSAFKAAVALACATPRRFKIIREPEIRKIRLQGFPYNLIYREAGEVIQILAVAHHRRRPEYWAGRVTYNR